MITNPITISRLQKQSIILITDILCICFAIWLSFSLRLGEFHVFNSKQLILLPLACITAIPIFIRFGLYRAIVRYVGTQALLSIFKAISLFIALWAGIINTIDFNTPRSIPIIVWFILLMLIGGTRIIAKEIFTHRRINRTSSSKNVLIYGAGKAGIQLAQALEFDNNMCVKGFIDDDESLHHKQILGINVRRFTSVKQALKSNSNCKGEIEEILIAIPSASHSRRAELIRKLEPLPVQIRILPDLSELAQGKISINSIKEIDIADLLGRDTVPPNKKLLDANIKNKAVMITGAGGSIGSELCRQILQLEPAKIILFERCELALYQIEKELLCLNPSNKSVQIIPILGCVTNIKRVKRVCYNFSVATVYHAAAYKHVPMVEKNISEGIKNNILGTLHCAQAAISAKVETFVLISTDKAVRPTNTMGATKRFAELILQSLSRSENKNGTCFSMVRFGNVLGSSGSVVPLFREQIRKGQAITVTNAKIIRYFMSIPEAAQLVIQAGAMAKGGDVFVLDMGEPVRILDLAKRMIRLSGFEVKNSDNPNGDIEIHFTGLRPGEKLYEELLIGNNITKTQHTKILRAEEEVLTQYEINSYIEKMIHAIEIEDEETLRHTLEIAVRGFKPQCSIVDELHQVEKSHAKQKHKIDMVA